MKFSGLFSVSLAFTSGLACLETIGDIDVSAGLQYAFSSDNGAITCSTDLGWRIDQDGHYSLGCLPGYVYAFTTDGSQAWYSNPVNAFSFNQPISTGGATISWDVFNFC